MVISGLIDNNISMGTRIGARNAHLAEAEPTNKLTPAPRKIIMTRSKGAGRPLALRTWAPLTAMMIPRLDQLKKATKWAATKASTM